MATLEKILAYSAMWPTLPHIMSQVAHPQGVRSGSTESLRDVVTAIYPGIAIPGAIKHDPDGEYHLLLPRHVRDDGPPITIEVLGEPIRMQVRRVPPERQVQAGDVLFMSRGDKNRSCAVVECRQPSIATSVFYLVRPSPQVSGEYLAWFLNQVPAQTAIASIRTGAGTPMVQRVLFEQIAVVVPSLERQREIVRMAALMRRERELVRKISELTDQRQRAIGQSILSES